MKRTWYDEIFKIVEQVLVVRLPFEFIQFPDSGVNSALNKYVESNKANPDSKTKAFFIDLRAAKFNTDKTHNKEELIRIIKSHVELSLDKRIDESKGENIYKQLESIIALYLNQNKKVLFIFQISAQINMDNVPDFRDFLLFLDRQRDHHLGNINFIISTTYPQFDEANPSPIPIITKYFNYYDPGRIYRTINEDVLNEVGFKRHSSKDVLKLAEVSGGLVSIVKNLVRDLVILDKKLSAIYDLSFDEEFFHEFQNCKTRLDRIFLQLREDYIKALCTISKGKNTSLIPKDVLVYLQKTGIVDEKETIRGIILKNYLNIYYCKEGKEVIQQETQSEGIKEEITAIEDDGIITINKRLKINKRSGQIFINGILRKEYLSEKELNIFLYLYSHPNTQIPRFEIAKVLWEGSSYSDWAMDKLISRIRDKIEDVRPNSIIKTIRGKGFSLIK